MFADICFGFWSQVHSVIIWGGQRPHLLKIQVHRSVSEGLLCSLYSKAVTLWDLGILLFSFPCLCVTQTCVTFYPAIFSPVAHRPAPKGQFGQPWQLVLPSVSGARGDRNLFSSRAPSLPQSHWMFTLSGCPLWTPTWFPGNSTS